MKKNAVVELISKYQNRFFHIERRKPRRTVNNVYDGIRLIFKLTIKKISLEIDSPLPAPSNEFDPISGVFRRRSIKTARKPSNNIATLG